MALSGLHIPAKGSCLTHAEFSDGDERAWMTTSTFSGHMVNLNIFKRLDAGSLVLLDELVVGTDPIQGAALAQALLERFVEKKPSSCDDTLRDLKLLPYTDNRFHGSMGADWTQYRLSLDAPGASSARKQPDVWA